MFLFYFALLAYLFFIIWILEGYKNVIKEDKVNEDKVGQKEEEELILKF